MIDDLALLRSRFLFLKIFVIFSSFAITLLEKSAFAFCFKPKIDKSGLPFASKTIISQICFPSSLIIAILSSAKIYITDKPPPLTKYLSTPGGKILNPGFFISLLVPNICLAF